METQEKYISSLLETHDCVIVPDFGGFVLNETPATFSGRPNEIAPPRKKASFNRNLNVNDGLLADFIAKEEGISYIESLSSIKTSVENWKKELANKETLHFKGVGSLATNGEGKIIFEPEEGVNYLKESYGLSAVQLSLIEKQNPQKIFVLPSKQKEDSGKANRHIGRSIGLATAACVAALAFALVFNNISIKNSFFADSGRTIERTIHYNNKGIQPIAASIGNIIDAATTKPPQISERETDATLMPKFYVVGGCFKKEANATKFVKELKEKGFNAQVLHNEDGWYRVSYLTEQDSLKADKDLHSIKINENQNAWLFKF